MDNLHQGIRMRIYSSILLLLVSAFFLTSTTITYAGTPVEFSWAVLSDTETGPKPLDFSSIPQLKNGTTLQIYIEQKPGAFIYIYLVDSIGGLSFIFPSDPQQYDAAVPGDQVVRIPPETARFELTPPNGQEKLYLLASPTRLTKLEQLTTTYLKNESDTIARSDVFKELKLIHRKHSALAQKTETSVPVAGTVATRGGASTFNAIHVKTDSLYSRILRINHD